MKICKRALYYVYNMLFKKNKNQEEQHIENKKQKVSTRYIYKKKKSKIAVHNYLRLQAATLSASQISPTVMIIILKESEKGY